MPLGCWFLWGAFLVLPLDTTPVQGVSYLQVYIAQRSVLNPKSRRLSTEGTLENPVNKAGAEGVRRAEASESLRQKDRAARVFVLCGCHFPELLIVSNFFDAKRLTGHEQQ